MKSLKAIFHALLSATAFALLASCGSGGGGPTPPAKVAPAISNLSYSPSSAYVSSGPLNFSGQFDFTDADGDLASVTLTIFDAAGTTVNTLTQTISGTEGLTGGSVQGVVTALLANPGSYTLQIYVTDAAGLRSNLLSGSVRTVQFPWTSRLAGPTARQYAAAAALDGRVYVLGGQRTDSGVTPGPATAAVEVYDPVANTWTEAPPMPTARMGLVAAVVNGRLYAIGGRTDGYSTSAVGTVEEFDPATQVWRSRAQMPTARYFAAGALLNGRVYVIGGEAATDLLGAMQSYDASTDSWTAAASLPAARSQLAAVGVAGRLYAVGGYGGLLSQWLASVDAFDPALGTWAARAPMPSERADMALVAVSGTLLAAGGENVNRSLDRLDAYDVAANSWSAKTPSPVAFTRACAAVVDGKVYLFGDGLTLEYAPANDLL